MVKMKKADTLREVLMGFISQEPDAQDPKSLRVGRKAKYRSLIELGRKTGVTTEVLRRFYLEGKGLQLDTIQKLCDYFGLRLTRVSNAGVSHDGKASEGAKDFVDGRRGHEGGKRNGSPAPRRSCG